MIPYFEQPALHLGPIGIHAFGVLVALVVVLEAGLFARRVKRLGLYLQVADGARRDLDRDAAAGAVGGLGAHPVTGEAHRQERRRVQQ